MKNICSRLIFSLALVVPQFGHAQSWDSLDQGLLGRVQSMTEYNGNLYAMGYHVTQSGTKPIHSIGVWDGTQWSDLSSWVDTLGTYNASAVYNGELYVAGSFKTAGGKKAHNIARWNGFRWDSVGSGLNDIVNCMTVWNGCLYIGGQFTKAGSLGMNHLACWNGSLWSSVGGGTDSLLMAMTIYNGSLVVVGNFTHAGGTPEMKIASWNGSVWSDIGSGVQTGYQNTAPLWSVASCNNNLYVGGYISKAGGVPTGNLACWNGSVWSSTGIDSMGGEVLTLYSFMNRLFMGGYLLHLPSGQPATIASWDGSNWTTPGSGIPNFNPGIASILRGMTTWRGALIAGGGFDSAGGVYSPNIAIWGTPTGIFENTWRAGPRVFPNPSQGIFHLENVDESKYLIEVFNNQGSIIYSRKNEDYYQEVDLSSQSKGLYFVRITNSNGESGVQKLIIE
jgi:hypothetical protein